MSEYLKSKISDYILIFFGTLFMAAALNVFFEPNNIVIGGATGIAVIIKYLTKDFFDGGISLGVSNLFINLPLFIIAVKVFGRRFVGKTIIATLLLSLNLELTSSATPFHGDFVIISVYGGVLTGIGLALIFRARATTGGSDLAASLIHQKLHHVTIAFIMLIIDVVIILCGFFVFGFTATMYAAISVFITSKIIDAILEGLAFAKATFIISDMSEEICDAIFKELERGVTSLYGKGMFTKEDKNILLCVVSKKEVFKLKEIAKEIDKNAFIMVADVREVLGDGF
jgi:uncharacterized membrane-anchored protein YitT (DUF2179 family)